MLWHFIHLSEEIITLELCFSMFAASDQVLRSCAALLKAVGVTQEKREVTVFNFNVIFRFILKRSL